MATETKLSKNESIPEDLSERFLCRQEKWRKKMRTEESSGLASLDFEELPRGSTESEAFAPSSYGIKK